MKQISIAGAVLLALTLSAAAQTSAPPAPPSAAPEQRADMPPPPPPGGPRGPRSEHEPPYGAAVRIDRGPEGAFKVDVRCGERDTTKDCADVASVLLDKLAAEGQRR